MSGSRLKCKYVLKYENIVKETNSTLKVKTKMGDMLECIVRDNAINSHQYFDAKVKSKFSKDPTYYKHIEGKFDQVCNKSM